ncbi:MAG TPA: hypothetical protein VFU16_01795 [Solirubrobacterales bacterium]|nr:hypothetical protein [Solirubrobacterales bacterium]
MVERKLSVGESVGEIFAIYREQAGVLLPVAFWLFLGVAILETLLEDSVALLLVIPLALAVTFLYQGLVVGLVRDVQDGRRDSSVGDLMRAALPVLLPLIGAGFVVGIGLVLGLLLLIVPGLFLMTIWAVTAPAIVIERRRVFDALRRSRDLVRGNGWPVFGVVLVTFLIGIVVGGGLLLAVAAIADGLILEVVLSALAQTVTAPIEALVASVLYFRLLAIQADAAPADSVLQESGDGVG